LVSVGKFIAERRLAFRENVRSPRNFFQKYIRDDENVLILEMIKTLDRQKFFQKIFKTFLKQNFEKKKMRRFWRPIVQQLH